MLKKILIYSLAFTVPPLILGTLLAFKTLSRVMILTTPEPVTLEKTIHPKDLSLSKKPKAAILVSTAGTQATSLMAAYGTLSASGIFDVFTVAQERTFLPITGGLAILPDYSFSHAPRADLLVIPAVLDPSNKRILDWVKEQAPKAKLVLTLCEGTRVLAHTGLLKGRQATSHFLALSDLSKIEPQADWKAYSRFVTDSNIITSAGAMASFDAILSVIEKWEGKAAAEKTAKNLGIQTTDLQSPQAKLEASDLLLLGLKAAFSFHSQTLEILLYPGVNEISLAALLDTLPRTLNLQTFTVAKRRRIIMSQYGMALIPQHAIEDIPPADMLLIPAGESQSEFKNTHEWVQKENIPVKSFFYDVAGGSYDRALDLVYQLSYQDDPATAAQTTRFVAKMINYPKKVLKELSNPTPFGFHFSRLWLWPCFIGMIGICVAWMLDRKISAKLKANLHTKGNFHEIQKPQ